MNKHLHRLVFSRRHGMRLAVAETARASGKAAAGERSPAARLLGAALGGLAAMPAAAQAPPAAPAAARPPVVFASKLPPLAAAASLPMPNTSATRAFVYDPARGPGSRNASGTFSGDLSASGAVGWTVNGNKATFNQGQVERVVINWDSFNIGAGYKVEFLQSTDATKYVSALNRIWSQDPSVILGSLVANREVILLNANGVYFGRGAQVDTGKFIATTNSIADAVFERGLRNITDGSAVFSTAGTDYRPTALNAAVSVEAGAEISTAAGGDVLLIAPRVANQGRISTPQGQAVLAAGDKVYLMSSSDPRQRGLIVAVDPVLAADGRTPDATLGTAENAAGGGSFSRTDSSGALVTRINEIHADSGTVNLVGLSVRQGGQINATTAVKGANGAIFLQAMASTEALPGGTTRDVSFGAVNRGVQVEVGAQARFGAALGTVEIGAGSSTAVRPAADGATQIDAEVFNPSLIRVEGAAISVAAGARVEAPGGRIELLASQSAQNNTLFASAANVRPADGSRIVVAPGAVISAAGLQAVPVDGARNQGTQRLFRIELADAPVQRSGPLYRSQVFFDLRDGSQITAANVGGAAAALGRTASERATAGGSISLLTDGALVVGEGATLDVSGGSVQVGATTLANTLLSQDGRTLTFRAAQAGNAVGGLVGTQITQAPAYTEGANGGRLQLTGRQLALAGSLQGQTVQGERQLAGTSAAAAPATLGLGQRDGNNFYLNRLELRPDAAPAIDAAVFQNPLQATLPGLGGPFELSLARVAAGGFGSLVLRAAEITQPRFGTLDLGLGGSLDTESLRLSLNGSFSAAGGRIAATTFATTGNPELTGDGDIAVSGASRLSTAGTWTNDTAGADIGLATRSQLAGGSVALKSAHSLTLGSGAVLDVSGGARLSAAGSLGSGAAGSLTLSTGTDASFAPKLRLAGAQLRGFDFGSGGTLALGAPELTVALSAPAANATATAATGFTLDPAFFGSGGFGRIGISALGDVRIASGTLLAPQLLNWQLAEGYRVAPSGSFSAAVAAPALVDTALAERKPVNLSLAAARPLNFFGGADLVVERGASVLLEPGASLSMSATRNLNVGAAGGRAGQPSRLAAPGGTLTLAVTGARGGPLDLVGFDGRQALWLGADAQLAVDGAAQLRRQVGSAATLVEFQGPSAIATPGAERLTGTVLGGGTINLNAARGQVVAEAGSSMSLDGASATLNLAGQLAPTRVAKPAGSLNVSSPEGFVLDGSVSARAPRGSAGEALADGGRINLQVGLGGVLAEDRSSGSVATPFDAAPRLLRVGDFDGWLQRQGTAFGSDLSQTLGNGVGVVRSSLLANAGWSAISLGAGDQLRFERPLTLEAPLGLQLNAPALAAAPGVQVELRAGSARLGDAEPSRQGLPADTRAVADTAAAQDTALRMLAGTIEVTGSAGLQGFSTVRLDTGAAPAGEIRFTAVRAGFGSTSAPRQQLNFAGELQLSAGQVYATSATQYSLVGLPATGAGDAGSRLRVLQAGGGAPARAPLSAFASLTLRATDIEQGGTLRQPFGQISLQAERLLTLGPGSTTSVSGNGASLLFGSTDNLSNWQLPDVESGNVLPLAKGVNLSAPRLATSASARVDASGGGQVLASEFFAGVGGSKDYFATPGLYAVLPDHGSALSLSLGGGLLPAGELKQLMVTMPGSGLAPGRYTLLPARYALLADALPQSAFLVSRAADQGKTVLRAPLRQDDGSVLVTAYVTTPGSVNLGTPGERFVVENAASFQARSDIRLTDISQLLADRSSALGQGRAALPVDAGQVQLRASGSAGSVWQAGLDLAARGGGQAGRLDVLATQLALVDSLDKTPAGALGISAQVLGASGAGSVLLGGQRSRVAGSADGTPPTWALDSSGTQSISVDLGSSTLKTEELLLAASQRITLAPGSQISASGAATQGVRQFSTTGDGAFVAVGANALQLQRAGTAGAAGTIDIGAGSTLGGAQVVLDASRQLQLDASSRLAAPALALGTRSLVLGAGAAAPERATVLDGALLAAVRQTADLTLRGYDSLSFVGEQNWAQRATASAVNPDPAATVVQQRLVLDSPLLRGVAAADGTAARTDIAAQALVLRNSTGGSAEAGLPASSGSGSLQLQALPPLRYGQTGGLTLGPGAVTLGFDSASLRSGGDITLQGQGSTVAQQDLTLSAARLTATSAAQQALQAGGRLRIAAEAASRTLGETVGLGAVLSLDASTLQQDGRIELPGGRLALTARGDAAGVNAGEATLRFGAGSLTSVAGAALAGAPGFTAFSDAGSLSASAEQGRIDVLGTLDASAARRADGTAGDGDAGRITLAATGAGGQLVLAQSLADGSVARGAIVARAGGSEGDLGGRLRVDVAGMASADALAQAAGAGGVNAEFTLRARAGDLALDTALTAQRIGLAADGGSLTLGAGARLDARAAGGGVVQLAAGQDLTLAAGSRIDASATGGGSGGGSNAANSANAANAVNSANGGDVLLASSTGRVAVKPGATVVAGSGSEGRIVLRALRGADDRSVQVDRLDTAQLRAGEVAIEAVRVYGDVGSLTAFDAGDYGALAQTTLRADNNAFMANRAAVLTALGVGSAESTSGRVTLRAGVEVQSSGDLQLADDWNFAGTTASPGRDRPGAEPGFLTLRAAGNLRLSGSLSDGFAAGNIGSGLLNDNARSWSYRLVAGADLAAAQPLAVMNLAGGPDETGNLTVDGGKLLRTGAGSIALAAGRDIFFNAGGDGDLAAMAYVAGRKASGTAAPASGLFTGQTVTPVFTQQGGRLDVSAARDVAAAEATQLVGNWLWRSGLPSNRPGEQGLYAAGSQLAWWTQFSAFNQTLGSFGGGGLRVEAGRNLVNVQAMAPTQGWADSRNAASAQLRVLGGGDVDVSAGRDVLGGQFLLGRGDGRMTAGDSIGAAAQNGLLGTPVLALQDGRWRIRARSGITAQTAFNPSATSPASSFNRLGASPYFYTWGETAAQRFASTTGDVKLVGGVDESTAAALGLNIDGGSLPTFGVMPGTLVATAATGNVDLDGLTAAVMAPAARGRLQLWAGGDVRLGSGGIAQLAMSDSRVADWAPYTAPLFDVGNNPIANNLLPNTLADRLPLTGLHAGDSEPVRVHAEGSLLLRGAAPDSRALLVPQRAELSAGADIVELSLRAQNLAAGDTTRISAGRNYVAAQFGSVELAGPGALEVSAGRGIDLGSSGGIATSGNLRNAGLPLEGASVRLAAASAGSLNLAAFENRFLLPVAAGGTARSAQQRAALLDDVRAALKQPALGDAEAWAAFQAFPAAAQAALGRKVLDAEFSAVYLNGRVPTAAEMTASLRQAFEDRKAQLLKAGDAAAAAGGALTLPGREVLQGDALASTLAGLRGLAFGSLDLDSTVAARVAALAGVQSGWRAGVALRLGSTVQALEALGRADPQAPAWRAYQAALADTTSTDFAAYRDGVLRSELASSGAVASLFGRKSLPMRLALFDQGFRAAELAGAGSFVAQPVWPGEAAAFSYSGAMELTQSSVVTQRGGSISLVNPGGAINVGLKEVAATSGSAPKGVIALGGGDIFGYAKNDFQVNTQRVFIVGAGNMDIWSSAGDIDSGRGANTAVAAPPLAARRSADGVVFEAPATTTGSGLGILEDARGRRAGTIGLYPAFGEILALDAFIRAPSVVLGSAIRGADNLQAASVGGAAAPVAAPVLAVAAPPTADTRSAEAQAAAAAAQQEARPRSSLLTVELQGVGPAAADDTCTERERRDGKCPPPPRPCSAADKAEGRCQ